MSPQIDKMAAIATCLKPKIKREGKQIMGLAKAALNRAVMANVRIE